MRYSDKLKQRYIDDIESWRWDKIRRDAQLQRVDGCDDPYWVNYIGGVLNLYPSGKIYAPWTTNQTMRDVIRDNAFQEALDHVADSQGAWINQDSGDVFACWPFEDELAGYRNSDGKLAAHAFPGGYPLFYLDADNNVLCPQCANLDYAGDYHSDGRPVAADINYESPDMYCDHCNARIESAYGED